MTKTIGKPVITADKIRERRKEGEERIREAELDFLHKTIMKAADQGRWHAKVNRYYLPKRLINILEEDGFKVETTENVGIISWYEEDK